MENHLTRVCHIRSIQIVCYVFPQKWNKLSSTFLCLSKQPRIHLLSYVANLAPQWAKTNMYFRHCLTEVCFQRKSGWRRRVIFIPLVPAESFFKGTSSYATGKVSWFSRVLAQHIPGIACQPAGGSHPAIGPHAADEWGLLDGEWGASGMGSSWGKQKVWLRASPDKCHPGLQTDKSATLSVSSRWCNRDHTHHPLLSTTLLCFIRHLPPCWQLGIGQVWPVHSPQRSLFPLLFAS